VTRTIMREFERIAKIPINQIKDEEWGVLVAGLLLKDAKEGRFEALTLREYCYLGWVSPSFLLKAVKPYLPVVEEELKSHGYVKVSRYGWRRFRLEDLSWDKIQYIAEKSRLSEREVYVLYVAWRLLKITSPWLIDWQGYNITHAFAFLDRFRRPNLTKEDVEWMRHRLLKYYRDQISEMGLDLQKLENHHTNVRR